MKLSILGNNGPYAQAGGACSGYLISQDNVNIVLDMGPGTLANLQRKAAIEDIDMIILSHLHYDHISDIFTLKYALEMLVKKGSINEKIKLFCPEEPRSIVEVLYQFNDVFDIVSYDETTKLKMGNLSMEFCEMTHPVKSFACRITNGSGVFMYSGDTGMNERITSFAAGADVLLLDGGLQESSVQENFQEKDIRKSEVHESTSQGNVPLVSAPKNHLTCRECGLITDIIKPERMILTHIPPGRDPAEMRNEAIQDLKNMKVLNVEVAEIMKEYNL